MMSLAQEAIAAFAERFRARPRFGAAAPGRVNLIGEHTDYNEGFVLPIAIDRETIVLASPEKLPTSRLVALDLGREVEIDLARRIRPQPRGGPNAFANYLLGVVHEFVERGCRVPNLDLIVRSSVPIGAGLSSSASVEVAMATLMEQICGVTLDPMEKILLCQKAEHEFTGTPCGIMDMYASTLAQAGQAMLIDCRSNESRPILLPPQKEMTLLIAETDVRHDLATSEYADRRAACGRAAQAIGVPSLRHATIDMIERASLSEIDRKRARHVVNENARTLVAAAALHTNDLPAFCAQMFSSHRSLRDLYEVSCPELDCLVDAAAEFAAESRDECIGARMTGGGFGGCAIVFCRNHVAARLSEIMRARFEKQFNRVPQILPTRACGGARRIELEE